MHILTNFQHFPEAWRAATGEAGTARVCTDTAEFLAAMPGADLVLLNGELRLVRRVLVSALLRRYRGLIVAVDLVLRRPVKPTSRLNALLTRCLFSRVDLFIHYFRDISGYEKYFGIAPSRSRFVPFKPNLRYRRATAPCFDGEYILCLGRSMRDYDTFFAAMDLLPYPAVILQPNREKLRRDVSLFTRSVDALPKNVRVLEDDDSEDNMVRAIAGARIVALPILPDSLCASGLSVYLNSMLLGKCVVITRGPGASDILSDQALFVPPADPVALAAALRSAWEDDDLRLRIARSGHEYAVSLGGEPELRQRVIDVTMQWLRSPCNQAR